MILICNVIIWEEEEAWHEKAIIVIDELCNSQYDIMRKWRKVCENEKLKNDNNEVMKKIVIWQY